MAFLFTVKSELCEKPIIVKINDVRFVGFPTLLRQCQQKEKLNLELNILRYNILFVLKASASSSAVKCFAELSKLLSIAIRHEEYRCHYLSQQAKIIMDCFEEALSLPESCAESPYHVALQKSDLAQTLQQAFTEVFNYGFVSVYINRWIKISFCLQENLMDTVSCKTPKMQRFLDSMRPYHTFFLLEDQAAIISALPLDTSPALLRLIDVYNPLKSLQTLAYDADVALKQVFRLVQHLVCWGKAMVTYPLCETNVYCVAPSVEISPAIATEFAKIFPGHHLLSVLSEFSQPTSLMEFIQAMSIEQSIDQANFIKMVMYLLKHCLIIHLQTYVFLYIEPGVATVCSNSDDPYQVLAGHPEESFIISSLVKHLRNQEEICTVLQHPASASLDNLKSFAKLLPYFDGRYHLEEIMYFENMRRCELLRIISSYQSILYTCSHEDDLSTLFMPKACLTSDGFAE
ncbi:unnamed protein product [Soboliphyme baturini]|uniref:GATOR complex protein NPRL3 n=1 Tax=Soboliphyme baturini TaxID=241478 RepID=A0A183IBL1_9BILA|nr:unnamed protein product [Soboliphyme baturini]